MTTETIAARATPDGRGALAIVRLSGPRAIEVTDSLFHPAGRLVSLKTQTCLVGQILADGEAVDQVVVTLFRAPHSFTGEDLIEITCHGGAVIPRRILELVFAAGVRPARPGEFTERAFVNGRVDLSQAEAVAALIEAQSSLAARAAMRVLNGGLREPLSEQLERLIEALAHLESRIDIELHSPDVLGSAPAEKIAGSGQGASPHDPVRSILAAASQTLDNLVARSRASALLTNSIRVVLAGRTNAGKSSIFNGFLSEERAIVSPEPRTTRDLLTASLEWNGLPIQLVDTAGFAPPRTTIECQAEQRTRQAIESATVIVWVVDVGANDPDAMDADIDFLPAGARLVVALHKWDLPRANEWNRLGERLHARSSVNGEPGLGLLREAILSAIRDETGELDSSLWVCDRQRALIAQARVAIVRAGELLEQRAGDELIAYEIQHAAGALGELLGRKVSPLVLDEIFARFCVGK